MDIVVLILLVVVPLTAKELTYRLPRDVLPKHYSLKLHPDMDTDTFKGEVTITLYSHNEKEKLILHSVGLNITTATINQFQADVEEESDDRISVKFKDGGYFQPGEYLIHFKYDGKLQEQFGLRKASYEYKSHKGFLVVNEFEPANARKAFPCFDEPSFKARFSMRLVAPNETYRAISNMPEIARYPTSNGIIYDFETSVKMSTYLISLAITDYPYYEEFLELNNKRIPIRVYTYNASKENNHYVIEGAKIAIKYYTEYTGLEYPLPKLDMIEYNKGNISATETWGLIQFKQGLLTTNLNFYDEWQCYLVLFHELGHFWFGNLVTNDWWSDLWLQEGFATFMSYRLMTKMDKSDSVSHIKLTEMVEIDQSEELRQIVSYLNTTKHIEYLFGRTVYTKAPYLLRSLENLVGEDVFQEAVRNFLREHVFGTVTTNDLISEFEKLLPKMNIRSFLESYIYQPGYPIVNIDNSSGEYVLTQSHQDGYKWTIPISYSNGNNTDLIWFDRELEYVTLNKTEDSDLIIFNTLEKPALYLVNYSEPMLTNLINNLKMIPLTDMRNVVDNTIALYNSKQSTHVNCGTVLKLAENTEFLMLDSLYKAIMAIDKDIACFQSEHEIFVENMGLKLDAMEFAKTYFNSTCSDYENKTASVTNGNVLQCVEWIRKNLIETTPMNNV